MFEDYMEKFKIALNTFMMVNAPAHLTIKEAEECMVNFCIAIQNASQKTNSKEQLKEEVIDLKRTIVRPKAKLKVLSYEEIEKYFGIEYLEQYRFYHTTKRTPRWVCEYLSKFAYPRPAYPKASLRNLSTFKFIDKLIKEDPDLAIAFGRAERIEIPGDE